MKTNEAAIVLALAALLLLASVVLARGGLELDWWTVDGGGNVPSSGGNYSLTSSIAQPEAGALAGGGFSLDGGVPVGGVVMQYRFHLPVIRRRS
jgi:hypothetical protein